MNILGLEINWAAKAAPGLDIDAVMRRYEEYYSLASGVTITPDNAMRSPTVQAIIQSVARRIATLPVLVLRKTVASNGRTTKELLVDHPVARLLRRPNELLTPSSFWLDATSWLVRFGNFYCWKARGQTGPVRRLLPLHPNSVTLTQDQADVFNVTYRVTFPNASQQEYTADQILHARGPARDGLRGDSPIMDVREAIGLEIAAETFGASFFGNGAMPGLIFNYAQGSQGHKTDEERKKFIDSIQAIYARRGRFKAFVVPKGMELGDPLTVDNDANQFLQTRQLQRTIICGAFGVPPHLVGDLSKGTFNNTEQQNLSFVANVVQPYCTIFEQAMEASLLTDEDRRSGVIVRFNLDAALRADFKARQDGLHMMRNDGVISANEWREMEGFNPISEEDGGEEYWRQGQSGQTAKPPGDDKPDPKKPKDDDDDEGEDDAKD